MFKRILARVVLVALAGLILLPAIQAVNNAADVGGNGTQGGWLVADGPSPYPFPIPPPADGPSPYPFPIPPPGESMLHTNTVL